LLKREAPDVASLQEIDSRSFWNGNFDQVEFLAESGAFDQSVRGTHVDGMGLAYGTALVAKLKLGNPEAVTFRSRPAVVPKGFVVSTVAWPGNECVEVDIVSVHLDFASKSVRRKQAAELIATLQDRSRPTVIMGDFNTGWQQPNSALRLIARELGLHPYQPDSEAQVTFPAFGERLDWILVSPEISFNSYRVVTDIVSDHRGVLSELAIDRVCAGNVL
jgi:endonuclease/exonuclease/phosphatase family metal-dependent hydrolase